MHAFRPHSMHHVGLGPKRVGFYLSHFTCRINEFVSQCGRGLPYFKDNPQIMLRPAQHRLHLELWNRGVYG
jgi:hypothetical protein